MGRSSRKLLKEFQRNESLNQGREVGMGGVESVLEKRALANIRACMDAEKKGFLQIIYAYMAKIIGTFLFLKQREKVF